MRGIDNSIEVALARYLDEHMDNHSVTSTFNGSDVHVFGGQMSREEWHDVADDLVAFLQRTYNAEYEVFSAWESGCHVTKTDRQ